MKSIKNLGTGALLCTLVACNQSPTSNDQYALNGTIAGYDESLVYLSYQKGDSTITDSTVIANGIFCFQGTLDEPVKQAMLRVGQSTDYRTAKFCSVYLEPKEMTVAIDTANFSKPTIIGSFTQAEADSMQCVTDAIMAQAQSLRDALQTCADEDKQNELREQMERCQDQVQEAEIAFVKNHPASFVSPFFMRFLMGKMTYQEIKDIFDRFTPEVQAYSGSKEIRDELTVLANVQPGLPAPLFRALNPQGDSIGIADFKGKYVLLDFWATWCVPCRKSFPHVKALYDKYHKDGLEVFCVADNDKLEDTWKETIKTDGIDRFHHVLRGLKWNQNNGLFNMDKTNDISDKYAIHSLPTKYLIDREGKIVGKFNDEELDAKLKEIFGK